MAGKTNVGTVFFDLRTNRGAFTKEIRSAGSSAQSIMSSSMGKVGKLVAKAFSVTAVVAFGKKCVQVASETQSAWQGLSSILNGQGKSFTEANSFIQSYIKDGLVPLNNAVSAYKNLAARGYSTDQIEKVMTALKDSAAFGRQASYSYGDAITTATEGLKNENSILVDNAGVTKNVAKMWEEYAKSIGTTRDKLTNQQKIQAEVNGIIKETRWQTGDAAKYADSFAGRIAKLSASYTTLKTSIGEAVMPIVNMFLPAVQLAIDGATRLSNAVKSMLTAFGIEVPDISAYTNTASTASQAAQAITDEGNATEAAAKKAKKARGAFAAFDEINVLSQSSPSSSSSSSGGSSSGGASSDTGSAGSPAIATTGKAVDAMSNRFLKFKKSLSSFWSDFSAGFDNEKNELVKQLGIAKSNILSVWSDIKSLGSPLKNWLSTDVTNYFSTACHTISGIFLGLFDSANTVFSDIWNVAVYPMVSKFITKGLPVITQFGTEMYTVLGTAFKSVKKLFDTVWKGGVVPVLTLVKTVFSDVWDSISEKWQTYGKPIFEGIKTAISNTKNVLLNAWNQFIKPCWDSIMSKVTELWTNHLKPLVDNFNDFVGVLVSGALSIYNKAIVPLVSWLQEKLQPVFTRVFNAILNIVSPIISGMVDMFHGMITQLKGIVKFITGVFTGDWKKAWTGIKDIFSGIWNNIKAMLKGIGKSMGNAVTETFKSVINSALATAEKTLNAPIKAINGLLGVINKVPGINIPTLNTLSLPRLAQGGWLAANNPRLAVVGDNRREGEIVAPESKIREQVELALSKFKGNAAATAQTLKLLIEVLVRYPDGRTVIKQINETQIKEGRILLEL